MSDGNRFVAPPEALEIVDGGTDEDLEAFVAQQVDRIGDAGGK